MLVSITLPEIYYSLNTERYARGFVKKYHPELKFSHMEGRYAVCEKVTHERPLSRSPKSRSTKQPERATLFRKS